MKSCTSCKKEKDLEDFYKSKHTSDGKTYSCKECMSKYRKENSERAREYMKDRREKDNEALKETKRKSWRTIDVRSRMLQQSRNRSRRKNIENNINIEDIIVPHVCPILGIPFETGKKHDYEHTPSLDRIDNTKGYIKGNIQVLTKKANSMKNSASPKELLLLADWIYKTFKS